MPLIPAAAVVLVLAVLAFVTLATRRAEARMGGHPTVGLVFRAYGA